MPNKLSAVQNLPVITWQHQRVITTQLLADMYEAKTIQIQQNFKNNASRFIDGIHYFKLTGQKLKDFVLQLDKIELQISSKTRSLMLWTERGTVRHAKMLGSDKAWSVQDQLEESYFYHNSSPYGLKQIPTELPKLTRKQQRHIQKRVGQLVHEQIGTTFAILYGKIKDEFQVGTYKDVPESKYPQLCKLLKCKPLDSVVLVEAEYKSLPMPKSANLKQSRDQIQNLRIWALQNNHEAVAKDLQALDQSMLSSWTYANEVMARIKLSASMLNNLAG